MGRFHLPTTTGRKKTKQNPLPFTHHTIIANDRTVGGGRERERGRPLRHDVGFSSIVLHTVPLEFAVAWLLDYLYSLCHHLHPQEPPLCLYLSLLSRRLITRHEPGAGGKTEDKSKKKVQFFIRRRRLVGDESAGRKRKKRGIHAPVTNATRRERNKERKSAQNGALESRSNVLKFI